MRYRFEDSVGPYGARRPQWDPFRGARDATRYGLGEFLALCERVGAEPVLVAPWVDGSPERTAAMVAYANAPLGDTTPLGIDVHGDDFRTAGFWAAQRAADGRADPWGVTWLEVGNEPYLGLRVGPDPTPDGRTQFRQCEEWIAGRAVPTTAARYADVLRRTARLVRAFDARVRIGAAALTPLFGEDIATAAGEGDREHAAATGTLVPAWNATLAASARGAFDFWTLHPYAMQRADWLSLPALARAQVHALRALAPEVDVAVTEVGFLLGGETWASARAWIELVAMAADEGLCLLMRHLLIEDDENGPFANGALIAGPDARPSPAYHAMAAVSAALRGERIECVYDAIGVMCTLHALGACDETTGSAAFVVWRSDDGLASGAARVTLPDGYATRAVTTLTAASLDATAVTTTTMPHAIGAARPTVDVPTHGLVVVHAARADR